jgi:hypothetical protein
MREATKTVATWLGSAAGLAGIEHGYFELLRKKGILPNIHSQRLPAAVTQAAPKPFQRSETEAA